MSLTAPVSAQPRRPLSTEEDHQQRGSLSLSPLSAEVITPSAVTYYAHDEVISDTVKYFKGDELAGSVWASKFALKDMQGRYLERVPKHMWRRLAREFARIEKNYPNPVSEEKIYSLFEDFRYIIPQGGPMAGIGNPYQFTSLSNCFVVGNDKDEDSYGGILKLDQEIVQLMKRRSGVGVDLSFIRPRGMPVKNSALTSTGVVPFMERFSNSTREVAQEGRRGALMESISIDHPDSEEFIDAKMTEGKVTGANVSVRLSDEFIQAALDGMDHTFAYPVDSDNPILTNIKPAKAIWKKIIHNAWKSAEPGCLFWDTVIRESLADCYADLGFKTVSTNPCGEIPLCAGDSCRLLAMNLYSYVVNPFTEEAYFDFDLFREHAMIAQRLMDDLVDLEIEKIDAIIAKIDSDPESEYIKTPERRLWEGIREKASLGRRTGLGITAEGDMLAALGLRYGSPKANDMAEEVHMRLKHAAYESSCIMAQERGAFPIWDAKRETTAPFLLRIGKENPDLWGDLMDHGRRNISLLTVAPTGSVSLMTQTTSGIEPAFLISYTRRKKINPNDKSSRVDFVDEVGDSWQEFPVFHHKFETWLAAKGYDVEEVKQLPKKEIDTLIAASPWHGATSNDVDWVAKVEMQGRVQKHVDHSISVTVNLPNDISEEMVEQVYLTAWRSGCKGITVYRDGSRSGVLVSDKKEEVNPYTLVDNHSPKRPKALPAEVVKFQNNLEKWIAFVGLYEGRPYEIFVGKKDNFDSLPGAIGQGEIVKMRFDDGSKRYDFVYKTKAGEEARVEGLGESTGEEYWNYARMISGVLRHGMPLPHVVSLINTLKLDGSSILTWKNGIARAIKKFIPTGETVEGAKCEDCGGENVAYVEGCLTCQDCGSSKCG